MTSTEGQIEGQLDSCNHRIIDCLDIFDIYIQCDLLTNFRVLIKIFNKIYQDRSKYGSKPGENPMEVRKIGTREEYRQAREVSALSAFFTLTDNGEYHAGTAFEREAYPSRFGSCAEAWAVLDNGRVLSAASTAQNGMMYYGRYEPMVSFGAVCTRAEARRQGNIRKLFYAVFEERKAKGCIFSYLYPFSYRYYGKFGYSFGMNRLLLKGPVNALLSFENTCEVSLFQPDDADLASDIKDVYEKFAPAYNGMLKRTDAIWSRLDDYKPAQNLKFMYVFKKNRKVSAFLGYQATGDGVLKVLDCAWLDPQSFRSVLAFIASTGSRLPNFEMLFPESFPVNSCLDEPQYCTCVLVPSGQIRVLSVEKALAGYPWPEKKGELAIKVTDDFFNENSGVYRIQYNETKAEIEKAKPDRSADLSLDIRELSSLLFGAYDYEDLAFIQGIEQTGAKTDLRQVFKKHPLFINVGF
jgi:predicted acetyltransferase